MSTVTKLREALEEIEIMCRGTAAAVVARAALTADASDQAPDIPDVLFNGNAVYAEMTRIYGKSHCHPPATVIAALGAAVSLMRAARPAPVDEAPAAEPVAWRVAEFWSSANPGKKVLMLAQGADIAKWAKRADFIRWVDAAPDRAPAIAQPAPHIAGGPHIADRAPSTDSATSIDGPMFRELLSHCMYGPSLMARLAAISPLVDFIDRAKGASTDSATATCTWRLVDDESSHWESACGESWGFNEGGPEENSMRFCHGCGKRLAIAAMKGET